MRAEFNGRRPFLAFTRRWIAVGSRTSGLTLAPLFAIAIACFSSLSLSDRDISGEQFAQSSMPDASDLNDASADQALADLRAYADRLDTPSGSAADNPSSSSTAQLPDVDTMIAKLVARLEKQPNDVKGWKMLGWSYLNTGMMKDAVKAYESALKLDPNDVEIKRGLEKANSADSGSMPSPPSEPVKQHAGAADTARDSPQAEGTMVRGMVDQLAARLDASPNDEAGWLLLMRSWMTLGDKEAAKASLARAIATFSSDTAVKTRLIAAARELGVESE